ncbi:MAG: hypothetical protein QM820_27995 [Minicystis sp.]
MRITGRPNTWTGRGAKEVIPSLRRVCTRARLKLVVVYTVHEVEGVQDYVFQPDAIITLNPDVRAAMRAMFPRVPVHLSRVPNLLVSAATRSVDLIRSFMGEPPVHGQELTDLVMVSLLRQLGEMTSSMPTPIPATKRKLPGRGQWWAEEQIAALNKKIKKAAKEKKKWFLPDMVPAGGLLIFGTITARHGAELDTVKRLCGKLDEQNVPAGVRVIIVGRTQSTELADGLMAEAQTNARLFFHGEIVAIDEVMPAKYAISFDKLGYRDNASAMVNMIRAGMLLFYRRNGESERQLIARTVDTIRLCEQNRHFYIRMLAAQHPLYLRLRASLVGNGLDDIFTEVAAKADDGGSG